MFPLVRKGMKPSIIYANNNDQVVRPRHSNKLYFLFLFLPIIRFKCDKSCYFMTPVRTFEAKNNGPR